MRASIDKFRSCFVVLCLVIPHCERRVESKMLYVELTSSLAEFNMTYTQFSVIPSQGQFGVDSQQSHLPNQDASQTHCIEESSPSSRTHILTAHASAKNIGAKLTTL